MWSSTYGPTINQWLDEKPFNLAEQPTKISQKMASCEIFGQLHKNMTFFLCLIFHGFWFSGTLFKLVIMKNGCSFQKCIYFRDITPV